MPPSPKPHYCVNCGATDPDSFYGAHKSLCKLCWNQRDQLKSVLKKRACCRICYISKPSAFAAGIKDVCLACSEEHSLQLQPKPVSLPLIKKRRSIIIR